MDIDLVQHHVLSVEKLMERFFVSRRTVDNWFKQGLPKTYIGRRVYSSLEAVQWFSKRSMPVEVDAELEKAEGELKALGVL